MKSENMKVLILGYGSREHALAWKIAQSPRVEQVYIAPGNAGTAQVGINVPISDEDVDGLVAFALEAGIDLAVVGTNDPLALGVVDAFQDAGLAIFGPNQAAAQLESSKAFAKAFMRRHNIVTPAFATFTDYAEASRYLKTLSSGRVVVKASGLGKMGMGVSVCDNHAQAQAALDTYMRDNLLGESGQTVIIEERIEGPEVSVFALSDGETAVPLLAVRDHKRIYDNDEGPNTGGMGAFSPVPEVGEAMMTEIMESIINPTIEGMAIEGNPYVGVLFAGLMLTDDGIQVLEYNGRFGNPEALVIMSLMASDLVDVMMACIEGELTEDVIEMRPGAAAAAVISSPQYPAEQFPLGLPISGVDEVENMVDVNLFHHGTAVVDEQLVTARGRVLAVTAVADDLPTALAKMYEGARKVIFAGAHYRRDIGGITVAAPPEVKMYPVWQLPKDNNSVTVHAG